MIYVIAEASLIASAALGFMHFAVKPSQRSLALLFLQVFLIFAGFGVFALAHINYDTSLAHVALTITPTLERFYRIAALWSDHIGSLFFWLTSFAGVVLLLMLYQPYLFMSQKISQRLGLSLSTLLIYILTYANPFSRAIDKAQGLLNPLLHDVSLGFHPPILYWGQLGLLTTCCLIIGHEEQHRAKLDAPLLWSWALLTLGITWGSFWAYYELGWGGWWFWDPVENIALLPWLLGIIMIHLFRFHLFHHVTFLAYLTIVALLSGVFLVRSGAVSSVHSFAFQPEQGVILLFTLVLIGLLLTYPITNWPRKSRTIHGQPQWLQHQRTMILAICFIVALTLFASLVYRLAFNHDLSFQPEFFEITIVPILVASVAYLGYYFQGLQMWPKIIALGLGTYLMTSTHVIFCALTSMIALYTIASLILSLQQRRINIAAFLAHVGVGIFALSAACNQMFYRSEVLDVKRGDRFQVAQFDVELKNIMKEKLADYNVETASFRVKSPYFSKFRVTSMLRTYSNINLEKSVVGTHLVFPGILFLTHRPSSPRSNYITVYARYDPFIAGVWLGGALIVLGTILAIPFRRRRYATRGF